MSGLITIGGAGQVRSTKVSRQPFWRKDIQDWVFLPVDKAHDQQVVEEDEEGNSLGSINVYESKGWMVLRHMTDNEAAMAKLPVNWRDVANKGAAPEYAPQPSTKAAKAVPVGDDF